MQIKRVLSWAALAAGVMMSSQAAAGVSGNIGVFSEYMFRGIEQTNEPAVQGGIDYESGIGIYAGTWASNVDFGPADPNTYEADFYAGYAAEFGIVSLDVGAVFYYYRDDTGLNTVEYYAGVGVGPVSLTAYVTDDYFGSGESAYYVTSSGSVPFSGTLGLDLAAGYSDGDAFSGGSEYLDYRIGLSKDLGDGLGFSIAVIGTDIADDDEKLVLGLVKEFDL